MRPLALLLLLLAGLCLVLLGPRLAADHSDGEEEGSVFRVPSGASVIDHGRLERGVHLHEMAAQLLRLMNKQPGMAAYTVTYETEQERVVLQALPQADALVELTIHPDGTEVKRLWRGDLNARLIRASESGRLGPPSP